MEDTSSRASENRRSNDVSACGSSGTQTPSSPPTMSGGGGRRKKNVKWSLGDDADENLIQYRQPLDRPAAPNDELLKTTSHGRALDKQTDGTTEQELRNHIYTMFSNQAPTQTSLEPAEERFPSEQTLQAKPKSALRSGTSTPVIAISPSPEPDNEIVNFKGKARSADRAKKQAENLSRGLNGSDNAQQSSNPTYRPSPHKPAALPLGNHSRSTSYHLEVGDHAAEQAAPTAEDGNGLSSNSTQYRLAGLSAKRLLEKMSALSQSRRSSMDESEPASPHLSPIPSKRPRIGKKRHSSASSLSSLMHSSTQFGSIAGENIGSKLATGSLSRRPELLPSHSEAALPTSSRSSITTRTSSASLVDNMLQMATPKRKKRRKQSEDPVQLKKHIEESFLRKAYLSNVCRALMKYGAPAHRLEEYMTTCSTILQIKAQFLYLPGCMIISFDDEKSCTAEVQVVKVNEGVDLGRLLDTYEIFKQVVHDQMGVGEANERLAQIKDKPKPFSIIIQIVAYGVASVAVAPFAFQGRFIDLPVAFVLGLGVGILRLVVASKSTLYSAGNEVFSVIVTSFISRWVGSARGGSLFCFSALAQSSIALILPGYIVLLGALELQSRSIVAGSVRLVFAIIYSLFIGFGLTVGTALYGLFDASPSSEAQCRNPMRPSWYALFVPLFALCLMVINRAKPKQMPLMLFIAAVGYTVSYFSSKRFTDNAPISSTLAALAVSVLANLYSRIGMKVDQFCTSVMGSARSIIRRRYRIITTKRDDHEVEKQGDAEEGRAGEHRRNPSISSNASSVAQEDVTDLEEEPRQTTGEHQDQTRSDQHSSKDEGLPRISNTLAAAAMLPAIFVLVPSGLSISGSLVQGIQDADQLTKNSTSAMPNALPSGGMLNGNGISGSLAFTVGFNVVQVAIGISVGLLMGTLTVYPFGKGGKWGGTKKTRTGFFTF